MLNQKISFLSTLSLLFIGCATGPIQNANFNSKVPVTSMRQPSSSELGEDSRRTIFLTVKAAQSDTEELRNIILSPIIPEAETCLNDALSKVGANFRIRLNLVEVSELSEAEEAGIPTDFNIAYPKIGDTPIIHPKGFSAKEVEIILTDKVQSEIVQVYLTRAMLRFYDSGAAKRSAELASEYSSLCGPSGICPAINRAKAHAILHEAEQLESTIATDPLTNTNTIYGALHDFKLNVNAPDNPAHRSSRTFAHEIMHAWGGLKDRYSPTDKADNLMSWDFTCKLDNRQIREIEAFRAKSHES